MAKQSKTQLVPVVLGFDYGTLKPLQVERLRSTANRIRGKSKRMFRDVMDVGKDLLMVKDILPHGQFGPWLHAEFGWSDRTARHFMDVAEYFGSKTEIISDLAISPSAAYLLAAPSTPNEARQAAIDRAQAGEQITAADANEIIASVRKVTPRKGKTMPLDRVSRGLKILLKRFQDRFGPDHVLQYARQLHEYASSLEKQMTAQKTMRN